MSTPEIRLSFSDTESLQHEFVTNLQHGRAFLYRPYDIELFAICRLLLQHPDSPLQLPLTARVVFISDAGIGFEFEPKDHATICSIERFVTLGTTLSDLAPAPVSSVVEAADGDPDDDDDDDDVDDDYEPVTAIMARISINVEEDDRDMGDPGSSLSPVRSGFAPRDDAREAEEGISGPDEAAAEELAHVAEDDPDDSESLAAARPCIPPGEEDPVDGGSDSEQTATGEAEVASPRDRQAKTRISELRSLSVVEQQKLARKAELADRVQLERLFGRGVWEALLSNPKLTVPEVARIARKGTVPRPLLEQILERDAWAHAPVIRRALLSNPRLGPEGAVRLLRATPRRELKTIQKGTAYSAFIREQARRLLTEWGLP